MSKKDPYLLTPGPLTTADETKAAMLHDWGSRDKSFVAMNRRLRESLLGIADGTDTHVCVPLQGSGTFVVEATLGTLVPKGGKCLVLVNGAYGHRMALMLKYMGRDHLILETPEDQQPDIAALDKTLTKDKTITHVAAVHCETTSGILNPVEDIAAVVKCHDRSFIIDAMSSFGAIPLSAETVQFDAIMASSNKCLEGVPGMGFAIIRRTVLEQCQGNAHSLSLDLFAQWSQMEKNGQWRFTPPTHVIAAFDAAIASFDAEGGISGRGARYRENCRTLVNGLRQMGFKTLLDDEKQAPIIVTVCMPADPLFDFDVFYKTLNDKGYVIYPGKLTEVDSFRIGCIGHLGTKEIKGALAAISETVSEMRIASLDPVPG